MVERVTDIGDDPAAWLLTCWADVRPALNDHLADVAAGAGFAGVLRVDGERAGFGLVIGSTRPLFRHWATVLRLQVHPRFQGRGAGRALFEGLTQGVSPGSVAYCAAPRRRLAAFSSVVIEPRYDSFLGLARHPPGRRSLRPRPGRHTLAREDGLEFLHLTYRDGMGLDRFYESCGFAEVGRIPGAIRVAPGDDRDSVLMIRKL
ncbi:hypothetical protein [Jiangella sp. DSM 45060]|uniref:GNAT family N-acetyltransferase n=1 Tax=Jiangella sp. DSM 45060 TaxID=1798224 RepID=UPI0008793FD4|nr:hypothetical protein SAMN04515669_5300 [Jiangella sp. DSM 45060]